MPAKSKAQQRFFGMVHAYQKGELENPSKSIIDAADSISKKDAKKFASTKHKGLPNHVKKNKKKTMKETKIVKLNEDILRQIIRESISELRNDFKSPHEIWNSLTANEKLNKLIEDNICCYEDIMDQGYEWNDDRSIEDYSPSDYEELLDDIWMQATYHNDDDEINEMADNDTVKDFDEDFDDEPEGSDIFYKFVGCLEDCGWAYHKYKEIGDGRVAYLCGKEPGKNQLPWKVVKKTLKSCFGNKVSFGLSKSQNAPEIRKPLAILDEN